MSYRNPTLSNSSDEETDENEEEMFWKRKLSRAQKRAASNVDVEMAVQPAKRRRNTVWLNVLNECKLDEALSGANFHKNRDTSRGVESYLVQSDSEQEQTCVSEQESKLSPSDELDKRVLGRLPFTYWDQSVSRSHIDVNFDSLLEEVKVSLAKLLNESNKVLLGQIVDVLGVQRSLEFYYLTEDVEKAGGLYFKDGSQRRSRGGVFLNLIKMSDNVTMEEKKAMFTLNRRTKDRIKRKRRQLQKFKAKQSSSSIIVVSESAAEPKCTTPQNSTAKSETSTTETNTVNALGHDTMSEIQSNKQMDTEAQNTTPRLSESTQSAGQQMGECEEGELTSSESDSEQEALY